MSFQAMSFQAMSFDILLGLGVSALLLVYLLTALMRPERF